MPKKPPSNPLTESSRSDDGVICLGDFYAVPALGHFIYMPTREIWPADNINDILPALPLGYKRNGKQAMLRPSAWLRKYSRVEQMTWAPGEPEIIQDRLIYAGGWHEHDVMRCLIPRRRCRLPASQQRHPWVNHIGLMYPDEAEHILDWIAHRVQHPEEKINHALGLAAGRALARTGIRPGQARGRAVELSGASPPDCSSGQSFCKGGRPADQRSPRPRRGGRSTAMGFTSTKIYAAAPPDVLPCVDKYIRRHYVPNAVGLIITSNHKTDGVYLPSDDRRYLMAWSDCKKEQFSRSSGTKSGAGC